MALTNNPKLALIPSGYKASKVYSVLPSDGVGDFDFSRDTIATRVNKQGLIETVASNVPRLNYPLIDGVVSGCPSLLLEPSRTNLYNYSNDVSFWTKSDVVTTSDYAISPDGTLNAFRAVFSSSTGLLYVTATGTTGTNNTLSVWAKSNNGSSNKFRFFANGLTTLSNDFIATDEWQRFEFTFNCTSVTAGLTGASDSATNDIIFYGFQHEVGSYATSYIPTSGSQTTRSAETCNNSGDVNTFNDSEGVLFWDGYIPNDGNEKILQISDDTNTNVVRIFARANGDDVRFQITDGGVNSLSQEIPISSNNYYKISLKYKENDISIWVNGFELYDVNNGSMPSNLNTLEFNSDGDANPFYGNTKQLQYFDTALTDTDLEQLTSWTSFNEMANALQYTII